MQRTGLQKPAGPRSLPAAGSRGSLCQRRAMVTAATKPGQQQQPIAEKEDAISLLHDPEARHRRLGGSMQSRGFRIDPMQWLKTVPRVRIRTEESRKMDRILELAVLNERLTGNMEPWEARQRAEFLRKQGRNWEAVYDMIMREEVEATLDVIEEASRKVDALEAAYEQNSIGQLSGELQKLQSQVQEAQRKLEVTQARVDLNLQRVNELKAEAAALERLRSSAGASGPVPARARAAKAATASAAAAPTAAAATATAAPTASGVAGASTSGRGELVEAARRAAVSNRARRGLQSSNELEDGLRNFWYPSEFSSRLGKDMMVPFEIFGEPWVLFRDEDGRPSCVKDQCAHRACPLSAGKVVNGQVECPYHGWTFNGDGHCTKMPSTTFCRGVTVTALPCVEKDGFVWVWPGNGVPDEVPSFTMPPEGYDIHAEIMVDVPVEHGLLMENLLDLAHAPFTHVSTFARGWPVPDAVKFHAKRMLGGDWDPYPIEMSFHPPCMAVSMIGLEQPGKIERGVTARQCRRHLHQLHVCMPSKPGHTRLLYRMSLDFMPWVRHVPFIDQLWKKVAGQVLGEDLVLVEGQQDRMERGGDTWANPVSYDKLAVRYRRWRNSIGQGDTQGALREAAAANSVSAGELFSDASDTDEGFLDQQQRRRQGQEPAQRSL